MRVRLDKIASSTSNVRLHRDAILSAHIPAEQGAVLAVRVLDEKGTYNQIEDLSGRLMTYHAGDVVAGVLGARSALRGYTGEIPSRVKPGDTLHLLNLGGVIGRCTSYTPDVGPPARVEVLGAVMTFPELGRRVGAPANIFPGPVALAAELADPMPPMVIFAGSCMHAGKTQAASALIRGATARGLRVGAAKVTGVALRQDTLRMLDHGALCAYSFSDVGLPSTCGGQVVAAARGCMNAAASHGLDLLVIELGDGIMGDYGVMDVMGDPGVRRATAGVVLAAADPVAAWGGVRLLAQAGYETTAVTGPATDNAAGCRAIEAQVGTLALNARTNPAGYVDALLAQLLPESLPAPAPARAAEVTA